jgi:hypothetical protein
MTRRMIGEVTYFWYRLISLRATVPGLYLWGFLTPPVVVDFVPAVFREALAATEYQSSIKEVVVKTYAAFGELFHR